MRIIPCVSVRWSGELSKLFAIVLFQIMTLSFPWKNQTFHAVPQSSSLQTSRNASEIMKFHENQMPCPPRQESAEGFSALKQIREAFVLWTWITQTCCCIFQNSSSFACSMPQLNTKISGSFFTFRVWICWRKYELQVSQYALDWMH